MINVHKDYRQAFLLEPTKLERLVNTIHERLEDHEGTTPHDTFEVFLTGNRREELTALSQVLALDNSRKRRITRLVVTCSASSPGARRPEHEVQVDFARMQPNSSGGNSQVVAVNVRSEAAGWASRTLSEVEEQVERTWLHHLRPVVILLGLLVVAVLLLASRFVSFQPRLSNEWWLNASDLDRIETMLAQQRTLTDEELREVSTTQLRNLVAARRGTRQTQETQTRRTLFLVVPLLVVVCCSAILLATCYPGRVFLWGDEVERYASTLQRRKAMWGIIVSVTVVGVSSRFFSEDLSSWLPH
jgi:hypothetical protein